jgi:hypothetical protein
MVRNGPKNHLTLLSLSLILPVQMVLRELVGEEGEYGEETVTTVTIVITDIDDELPVFSRDKVAVPVPEDIGKI